MANLRANKIVGIGSTDAGVTFDGPISLNTQGYMYFPTGNTTDRGRGRMLIGGGGSYPSESATIYSINIQSQGNTVVFGDLTQAREGTAAVSSVTRAVFGGGYAGGPSPAGAQTAEMSFLQIQSQGNALDFGDLTGSRSQLSGGSNSTRGLFFGGFTPSQVNNIDFITIATTGNGTDFGDKTVASSEMSESGTSNAHGGL